MLINASLPAVNTGYIKMLKNNDFLQSNWQ